MKTLKQGKVSVKLAWMVPGTIALALALGCEQPQVLCQSGRGPFAVKYNLLEGTGSCSEMPGDTIGLHTYYHLGSDRLPDYRKPILAAKPEALASMVIYAEDRAAADPEPAHLPYSLGDFDTAEPDGEGFCAVSDLSAAEENLLDIPEIPDDPATPDDDESQPAQAAIHAKYEWTDFKVLVTAAYPGTQFLGTLTYSENGCTARYEAWGVAFTASCDDGNGQPNEDLCSPVAIPEKGIMYGSGISPDFPVTCDPDLLICVLTKRPPALK